MPHNRSVHVSARLEYTIEDFREKGEANSFNGILPRDVTFYNPKEKGQLEFVRWLLEHPEELRPIDEFCANYFDPAFTPLMNLYLERGAKLFLGYVKPAVLRRYLLAPDASEALRRQIAGQIASDLSQTETGDEEDIERAIDAIRETDTPIPRLARYYDATRFNLAGCRVETLVLDSLREKDLGLRSVERLDIRFDHYIHECAADIIRGLPRPIRFATVTVEKYYAEEHTDFEVIEDFVRALRKAGVWTLECHGSAHMIKAEFDRQEQPMRRAMLLDRAMRVSGDRVAIHGSEEIGREMFKYLYDL